MMPRLVESGHELISGTIGMGKSYFVVWKIVMSMIYNRPCCYIDPKGDTMANLVNFFATTTQGQELWDALSERILIVNPVSASDHLLGFHALAPYAPFSDSDPDRLALLANALVSHIRGQSGFDTFDANRLQNIMAAAVGLLAQGGEGRLTLAELPLLFAPSYRYEGKRRVRETHNPFVRSLLDKVTHHGTRSFWLDQWPSWSVNARSDWVQSTEGRIFQYLFDERLLMSVCATGEGGLDFQRIVEGGYWLFVNIPYPLLSDTVTTLLGNLLVTRLFYACMQRPPGSRPYRLILDEARFFNSGPLDVILETARAYNLWLTLVLQSLDQMCRTTGGRVDAHLKETALNNARYFSVFHNTADNETLARLMFPVTGRVVTGYNWKLGTFEYLPVAAEVNALERRFMELGKRQVVLWDKLSGQPPQVWRTPEVIMDEPDPWELAVFEAEHLAKTGAPKEEILAEINGRQARVRELFSKRERPAKRVPDRPAESAPERTTARVHPGGRL
jgi:hypothetical protein